MIKFNSCLQRSSILLALLFLSACSENSSTVNVEPSGSTNVSMSAPAFLTTRAILQENLRLTVTLNGTALAMAKNGDTWTGTGEVAQNDTASLAVEWNEAMSDSTNLLLARYNDVATNVNTPIVFNVTAEQYETEGAAFDADDDLISNLNERRQESDPFDAMDPGMDDVAPMVKIAAVRRTPTIDGAFDSNNWNFAQFQDVDDLDLRVDNLIVDEVGDSESESVNYGWAAMHDARYLSIFVFGRVTDINSPPSTDSGLQFWEDDSMEIFIDGNLSADTDDYDAVDDLHIMIPLAINDDGEFADNNSDLDVGVRRIQRGTSVKQEVIFDVLDPDIVEFATCVCFGQRSTWEVRIDMVAAQIPVGKTFGFEVQINVDDDGSRRDTKWAWSGRGRVPGDTNENTDIAWLYPSAFGLVQLLPFGGG